MNGRSKERCGAATASGVSGMEQRIIIPQSGRFFFKKQSTMQIQIFTIPVFDKQEALEEMNRFLRGRKVISVEQEFFSSGIQAYWSFSVNYIESVSKESFPSKNRKEKVDYKTVLDEATFKIFSNLRVCRKEIAIKTAKPAYAIFTDAELAKIAKLEELAVQKLLTIKGIGKNKVEKFGQQMLDMYHTNLKNETSG